MFAADSNACRNAVTDTMKESQSNIDQHPQRPKPTNILRENEKNKKGKHYRSHRFFEQDVLLKTMPDHVVVVTRKSGKMKKKR
jgi:hypothetical protein